MSELQELGSTGFREQFALSRMTALCFRAFHRQLPVKEQTKVEAERLAFDVGAD
ncbi:hypothetical protein [Novosphingobium sp. AP12]|uniref:hypothetical protein n=1 Tax=Novosphingobium sp. AP12 TaxID=1144305 RepID=UPI00138AD035|nr:hypothetical protein [Novosphingobium sp. AP12]